MFRKHTLCCVRKQIWHISSYLSLDNNKVYHNKVWLSFEVDCGYMYVCGMCMWQREREEKGRGGGMERERRELDIDKPWSSNTEVERKSRVSFFFVSSIPASKVPNSPSNNSENMLKKNHFTLKVECL